MSEQPLVSIGVPIAKCAYLREALACWAQQTYKNFEVLLSDDAAPGNVREAVKPYLSDSRFTYVRQKENSAPHFTRNWNACLERAKGKYFVLASDDDLYTPNFLERMVALAETHLEGDIFFAGWTMLTPGGADGWVRTPVAQRRNWESAVTFLYHRYALGMRIVAPPVLVRTEALRAIGGFADLPAAWFSDDLTWVRLAQRGGVFFEPELLVDFRMAGQNVTMSRTAHWMREKFAAVDTYEHEIVPLVQSLPATNEADRLRKAWLEQGLPRWLERHRQELAWDLPFHKAFPFYWKRFARKTITLGFFIRSLATVLSRRLRVLLGK